MKLFLLLFTCCTTFAANPYLLGAAGTKAAVGGGPTWLLSEDFTASGTPGYDWTSTTWTENAGAPDENATDYTWGGTGESLKKVASVYTTTYNAYDGTGFSPCYFKFAFRYTGAPASGSTFFEIWGAARQLQLRVYNSSGNKIQVVNGSDYTSAGVGTTAINADTWYIIWVYYKKGSGSDGECTVWVNTSDSLPVSADITATGGKWTQNALEIDFVWETGNTFWFDYVRIDDVSIN